MPMERGEGPLDVTAKKGFGRFEEIALRDIGRELGDGGFGDGLTLVDEGRQFAHLLDEQPGVGADFGEHELHSAGIDGDIEFLGLGHEHAR